MRKSCINCFISLGSGAAAYFLAGRTLRPIKLMVDEQNQFITDTSHELRTPLATLRAEMEASLLEKRLSVTQAKKLIKSNLEDIGTLQDLIDKLLRIARIHHLNGHQPRTNVSLTDAVEAAVKKVKGIAHKHRVLIVRNQMPEAIIRANKDELVEVIAILLDNAIKYSQPGSQVKLGVKKTNKKVWLWVKDTGTGIAEQDLPHIFERFYRADKSRSETEGFGLGLSIAKKIITDHNGNITAVSQPGKGSKFSISLPFPG